MKKPSIIQYLLSTCLFTIDELTELYGSVPEDKRRVVADKKFNERDIEVRLGYPFRHMVHYEIQNNTGKKNGIKINHDLYVESKDFEIEIKYLRRFESERGTPSNRQPWDPVKQDFDWIVEEIKRGNKGKRAFVMGWFNCGDSFANVIQLGASKGTNPKVNADRLVYFPFLNKTADGVRINDLSYNYTNAYEALPINLENEMQEKFECMFLGNETDVFHFAIYY